MAAAAPAHVSADRVFDFDIYADPRVTSDVQGSYARALAGAPDIFYSRANGGHWIVTSYDLISEIVKDPEFFSCREMQIPRIPNPPVLIPLNLDPPENQPYRQVLMPLFSPKAVRDLEPKLRERAKEVVDDVARRGECDFAQDVAARYPVSIFMDLMGMPTERLREFRATADEFFSARTPEDFASVQPKIMKIVTDLIELRQKAPGADLVSAFLAVTVEGGRKLTVDEIQRMCFLLFLGGMDTVTNVTGFAYQYLAQDPDLQQRLAENPDQIPAFVEECLRMFGVVSTPRIATRDFERFGVKFREGDMVLCVLALGGRDGKANPQPETFDLERKDRRYLAFSSGPHLCVGHILARAEMKALTEEWLRRIPSFSIAPGASRRFRLGTVNALETLPLQWWDVAP